MEIETCTLYALVIKIEKQLKYECTLSIVIDISCILVNVIMFGIRRRFEIMVIIMVN